jgi:hypothetical protein
VKRLEALAIELVRLLALERRREDTRFKPATAPSHEELAASVKRVLDASRVPLCADGTRGLSAIRNGWHGRAPVIAALLAVGDALNAAAAPPDDAPDTGRDLDDAATEAS